MTNSMLDISQIKTVDTTFEITHPATDENVGIRVTLMSQNDPRMKAVKRKVTDFNIQKQKRGKSLKAVEIEKNELELLAATLTGWEWYGEVGFKGEKPKFNVKNVMAVLKELDWFKAQIDDELSNEKGFFTS